MIRAGDVFLGRVSSVVSADDGGLAVRVTPIQVFKGEADQPHLRAGDPEKDPWAVRVESGELYLFILDADRRLGPCGPSRRIDSLEAVRRSDAWCFDDVCIEDRQDNWLRTREPERWEQYPTAGAAAEAHDLEALKHYVERGADPNGIRYGQGNLLDLAVAIGDRGFLDWLLARGVDPAGSRAVAMAAGRGDADLVEELTARGFPFEADYAGSALVEAIRSGRADVVRSLLIAGADPEGSADLVRPAIVAAGFGRNDLLRMLLDFGADIEAESILPGGHGHAQEARVTALLYALQQRHADTVRFLLAEGADPHHAPAANESPFQAVRFDADMAAILDAPVEITEPPPPKAQHRYRTYRRSEGGALPSDFEEIVAVARKANPDLPADQPVRSARVREYPEDPPSLLVVFEPHRDLGGTAESRWVSCVMFPSADDWQCHSKPVAWVENPLGGDPIYLHGFAARAEEIHALVERAIRFVSDHPTYGRDHAGLRVGSIMRQMDEVVIYVSRESAPSLALTADARPGTPWRSAQFIGLRVGR